MYDNEYFVVDLAACLSTGEIITNLSLALETLNHSSKKIVLKLNDNHLSQSQLLSIQSLITSWGCILDTVETVNQDTWKTAESMNIFVQKPIEKRLENYNSEESTPDVSQDNPDNSIAIKSIDGLHFEADLDAIKKQEDDFSEHIDRNLANISVDLNNNFNEIGQQILSKYDSPLVSVRDVQPAEFEKEPQSTIQPIKSIQSIQHQEEIVPDKKSSLNDEVQEGIKNSIGVYKKAYDNGEADTEWENVDFYESPTNDPVVSDSKSTTYINQTLRSGQTVESEGNIVIIGDCHPGSEIRAVGDITVWGVLSGIAHAGIKGNHDAKIRALKMNALQLRIASYYSRRPDTTNIPYVIRSSVFTPEEARVVDEDIVLYKINQN